MPAVGGHGPVGLARVPAAGGNRAALGSIASAYLSHMTRLFATTSNPSVHRMIAMLSCRYLYNHAGEVHASIARDR